MNHLPRERSGGISLPLALSPAGGGPESEDDRQPTVPRLAAGFVIVVFFVETRVMNRFLGVLIAAAQKRRKT